MGNSSTLATGQIFGAQLKANQDNNSKYWMLKQMVKSKGSLIVRKVLQNWQISKTIQIGVKVSVCSKTNMVSIEILAILYIIDMLHYTIINDRWGIGIVNSIVSKYFKILISFNNHQTIIQIWNSIH
jgi:predicted transglutaminase-like protease